jgi:SAM-dependent methyltransferase
MTPATETELELIHQRYQVQAGWTKTIRHRMLAIAGAVPGDWILEVGSGTGAISSELSAGHAYHVVGIDIDPAATKFAFGHDPISSYAVADGIQLPFSNQAFDIVLCHFLLLWVSDPARVLEEMLRAAHPGGWIIALAEPDYGGRIDHPPALEAAGIAQRQALAAAGAEPDLGRQLRSLFIDAGVSDVQSGVLGAEWQNADLGRALESERDILARDIKGLLGAEEIDRLLELDREAALAGKRTLFVPTFFAIGQAPS